MDFDFSRYAYRSVLKEEIPEIEKEYKIIMPEGCISGKMVRLENNTQVVFDFKEEVVGYLQIKANGCCEMQVDYAEVLYDFEETGIEMPTWFKIPTDKYDIHSEESKIFNSQGRRAFRYVKISVKGYAEISQIEVRSVNCKIKNEGNFKCNNQQINDIYEISKRTTKLCMQDYFEDGIKRDGLLWISDSRIEILCDYALFGEIDIVKRSIIYFIRSMRKDGYMPTNAIIGGAIIHPKDINYMFDYVEKEKVEGTPGYYVSCGEIYYLTYCADFILMVCEYYKYSRDLDFTKKVMPYVDKVLKRITEIDGLDVTGKLMPSISRKSRENIDNLSDSASYYFKVITSLRAYEKVCKILSREPVVDIESYINIYSNEAKQYMDKKSGVFFYDRTNGNKVYSQVGESLAYLAGFITKEEYFEAIERFRTIKNLAYPECGLSKFTTLSGIFESGNIQCGIDFIKNQWSKLCEKGYTTCLERWDHENMNDIYGDKTLSACHGWSASPALFIIKYILGVQIVEDKENTIKIKPYISTDIGDMEGSVPTKYGMITVKVKNGEVSYQVPKEIKVVRGL